MAKTKEAGGVYQLKITLRDIKPPVWRRVQVKDCTLGQLNDII
ncbi:MAG: IS1096 element passenger TnpR family protein, partial [Gemmataceae bacterium]